MNHLAAGSFRFADDFCNFQVAVIEYVVQQENRSFLGAEALQHGQESDGNLVTKLALRLRRRREFLNDRFGKPRTDVLLALFLQMPQAIETKACGDRDQEGNGRADFLRGSLMPAQISVL